MNTYITKINTALQVFSHQSIADIAQKITEINPAVKVASCPEDINKIINLRCKVYKDLYPDSPVDVLDEFDNNSILLYTENNLKEATSTCRLILDNKNGFVEEDIYAPYISGLRHEQKRLIESGRLIVTAHSKTRAVDYLNVIQGLAVELKVDYVLMFNRQKDVSRLLASIDSIKVLTESNKNFGGNQRFSAMLWEINPNQQIIYEKNLWDEYAQSFMTVTTSFQSEMLKEASNYLYGNVVDCGAGCAKIAPYLMNNDNVVSYIGLDASHHMCRLGNEVLKKVDKSSFQMIHSYIEKYEPAIKYDSAVSINSLYTWKNPANILTHIYKLLKNNGVLVLANVNTNLDIKKLSQQVEADLLMHPDADVFHRFNLQIADNVNAHRYTLNSLIHLVHQTGFTIQSCHDRFFDGGVTFMVLIKA